jgi:ribosomal protein L37AE/L43A
MTYSSYELKYCERCGGLGLRRHHSGLPYCRGCEQMMQKFLVKPAPPVTSGQLSRTTQTLVAQLGPATPNVALAQEAAYAF